jgi:hypothetical protein
LGKLIEACETYPCTDAGDTKIIALHLVSLMRVRSPMLQRAELDDSKRSEMFTASCLQKEYGARRVQFDRKCHEEEKRGKKSTEKHREPDIRHVLEE